MKKLALTNLMLLIAIKSVSACSYLAGSNKSFSETLGEIGFYTKVYLFSIFSLFLANTALIYLRKKRDYLFLYLIVLTALVMLPLTFFGMALEGCDPLFVIFKWELIFMLTMFAFHLGLWVTNTNLPDWRIDKGNVISLKLK